MNDFYIKIIVLSDFQIHSARIVIFSRVYRKSKKKIVRQKNNLGVGSKIEVY